jgi:hypothetical protein
MIRRRSLREGEDKAPLSLGAYGSIAHSKVDSLKGETT